MHPLVRDLYRRILHVGKDYPGGLAAVRHKAKEAFRKDAQLTSEEAVLRAVHRGRWWVKEMIGVIQLKKYRAMRARYGVASEASEVPPPAGSPAAPGEQRLR